MSNSTSAVEATVGTQDFDAFCYTAFVYGPSVGRFGPNANCGIYPQESTTDVARTAGWHELSVDYTGTGVNIGIDGNTVYTYTGNQTFDTVTLYVQAPVWRPSTVAYFDDFSLAADPATSTPEPSSMSLVLGALLLAGVP